MAYPDILNMAQIQLEIFLLVFLRIASIVHDGPNSRNGDHPCNN